MTRQCIRGLRQRVVARGEAWSFPDHCTKTLNTRLTTRGEKEGELLPDVAARLGSGSTS